MNNAGEYQKKIENKSNGYRVTFANVIHSIRYVCLNKLLILWWHALCTFAIDYLNDLPRRIWCAVAIWSSDLPLFNDFIQLETDGTHSSDKNERQNTNIASNVNAKQVSKQVRISSAEPQHSKWRVLIDTCLCTYVCNFLSHTHTYASINPTMHTTQNYTQSKSNCTLLNRKRFVFAQ